MQKLITLIGLFLSTGIVAQEVDLDRMNRNIEAAENILATLFESAAQEIYEEEDDFFVLKNKNSVEGTYIRGFGALFTVSPRFVLGSHNSQFIGDGDQIEQIIIKNEAILEMAKKRGKNKWKYHWDDESFTRDSVYTRKLFQTAVREFVKDYAYLLRQIPGNEKIMIRLGGQTGRTVVSGIAIYSKNSEKTYYSASILKSDVDAFQRNSYTEESLYRKINFTFPETVENPDEDRNLRMIANIFTDLYRNNEDNPLNLNARVSFEKINGLGAIYYIDMNRYFGVTAPVITLRGKASNIFEREERVDRRERPEHPERLEESERDYSRNDREEKIRELEDSYQVFLEDLQFNIVEYGSIVKDLKSDEALIFKVRFDQRRNVLPKEVEITAPQAILKDFRADKISLEEAARRLKQQEVR